MLRPITCGGVLLFAMTCAVADEISFKHQIRPILSDKCFQCHGPDAGERQAGLRLDDETIAKAALESGAIAIVPSDTKASALVDRIHSSDPDLVMPPPDSGKSLNDKERRLLVEWIESGANWQQLWSLEPITRPAPGAVRFEAGIVNDIDRFIRRRIQTTPLSPSSEADRVTLIRRVTLDLTGLPPTIEEVDAFLADGSPDAWDSVVTRLLNSPRFGEHMARFWLDGARYGDTHGLHLDNYREMWAYRDWVVNAYNANMPFDQFTIEQLAGDLLPNPTEDQIIATGFNRCHVTTSEGGSIAEEVYTRNVVDRVVTTGTVFMGLTMDCTRCHDHKFDPLTMRDFYSMFGYFNSLDANPLDGNIKDHAPVVKVLTTDQKTEIAALEQQVRENRSQISNIVAAISYTEPASPAEPVLPEPQEFVWVEDDTPAGAKQEGNTPWTFQEEPKPVFSGKRSHTRTAKGLSQHFFTEASEKLRIGENDILFCYVYLDPTDTPKEIMLQFNDGKWEHRAYWGGDHIDWGAKDSPARFHKGELPKAGEWVRLEVAASDVGLAAGTELNGWAFTQFDGTVHWDKAGIVSRTVQNPTYDSIVLWERDQKATEGANLPESLRPILTMTADQRTAEQQSQLQNYFLAHDYTPSRPAIEPLDKAIVEAEKKVQAIRDAAATTLVFREKAELKPAYLLTRGEYDQPGEAVERALPASLPPMPDGAPNNRLGVAQWLTSPQHPLTSRVTVNRFWQQFFGTGLVKTSEDFGSQGESPSHPELLDWLASEFMQPQVAGAAHPWDVKHLVRLIVTSATYRQSSRITPQAYEVDPNNRLLARGPRYRLDAEELRDQALFVSGLLVDKLGGPSVKPPQPDGLWFAVGYSGSNTVRFKADEGRDKVHRRTLYTFIKRTAPPPQMSTFDAPSREACTVRRERTNSPLQALLLLNDPQYLEAARALAERAIREGGTTTADKAQHMLRLSVLRHPTSEEIAALEEEFQTLQEYYKANPQDATSVIKVGTTAPPENILTEELAAWTIVANLVLNLDEVINKN